MTVERSPPVRWARGITRLVAAVMSYRHMYALLLSYGEDSLNASIGPLAVDGLMVVASLALLALGTTHQHPTADTPGEHTTPAPAAGDAASTNTGRQTPTGSDRDPAPADVPAGLVMSANLLAARHHNSTGQPIAADALADQLGIDHHTARRLLGVSAGSDTPPARINGHNPVKVATT